MSLGEREGWPRSVVSASKLCQASVDLGSFVDLEAHAEEDVLDLALHLSQEMQPAAPERLARQRHVEGALRIEPLERFGLDGVLPLGDRSLEPPADAVQQHAGLAVADAAKRLRQVASPAEVAHARVVEVGGTGRRGDCSLCVAFVLLPIHRRDSPCWSTLAETFPPRHFDRIGRASVRPRRRAGAG